MWFSIFNKEAMIQGLHRWGSQIHHYRHRIIAAKQQTKSIQNISTKIWPKSRRQEQGTELDKASAYK